MASEADNVNSTLATVQRLNSYPVINFAVNQVSSVYQTTKVKSNLLKGGLERIESSFTNIMTTALHPFQQHIVAADGFADRQLQKLEEKLPIVKESSDKIRSRLEDNLMANINTVRQSYVVESVSSGIDKVLDVTDNTVDYILPAVGESELATVSTDDDEQVETIYLKPVAPEQTQDKTGKVDRIYTLTSKVKRRLYTQMTTQLANVKQRSPEIIEKFKYSVDLIAYDKAQDKKNPFPDEDVASKESVLSTDSTSDTKPEGRFAHLKKKVSNIQSAIPFDMKSYTDIIDNQYPFLLKNIRSAQSYVINLMAYGVNYGETLVKKYPIINDNLLRVQSILIQVVPEGLKERLPLLTKKATEETSGQTSDKQVEKDLKNCDSDAPKSIKVNEMSTIGQGSAVKESLDDTILMEDITAVRTTITDEYVNEAAKITNDHFGNEYDLENTGKPDNSSTNHMREESLNGTDISQIDDVTSESSDSEVGDDDNL